MASCVVLSYGRVLPVKTSGHCVHSIIATAAVKVVVAACVPPWPPGWSTTWSHLRQGPPPLRENVIPGAVAL
eukprot:16452225-Heterocapsa_arctica.AAC.1